MIRNIDPMDEATYQAVEGGSDGFGSLETDRGRLPLVALEVRANIAGLNAETHVRQTFRNALDEPLEATYIFPLPCRAAVTRFRMRVADRTVDGELKERGEARRQYDEAIQQGHRAAIAEEERSGVFTLRVGNIPAQETIHIELSMIGPLPVSEGEATFRFPLVVAPRYTPGVPLDGPSVGQGVMPDTEQVPDASRVTPPVLLPGFPHPVELSLQVELDPAGLAAAGHDWAKQFRSSLHSTLAEAGPPWTVRLQPGERLNRDFILRFPIASHSLSTSLLFERSTKQRPGTLALTVVPPAAGPETKPQPREVVFVLDRSGSMGGWKMVAARRALGRMVDTLLDEDRFTVLTFDQVIELPSHARDQLVEGTDYQRWRMLEWLARVEARGGTEMGPALIKAVKLLSEDPQGRDQIIVLVTDGQVTGEDALLRGLTQECQDRRPRIFTVGIDRAVNAGLLRRLADFGGGDCELVESHQRLDEAMDCIHRLLAAPTLTQIRLEPIDFDWVAGSVAPSRLPDLYADRPITVLGRHLSDQSTIRLKVHGIDQSGKPWQQEITGQVGASNTLLNLWGRAKVRELEDEYASGRVGDPKKLMQQVINVSLESHALCRFTAYVAVDRSQIVNQGGVQSEIIQPVEIPDGWQTASVMPAQACASISGFGMSDSDLAMRATFSSMKQRRASASPKMSMPVRERKPSRVDELTAAIRKALTKLTNAKRRSVREKRLATLIDRLRDLVIALGKAQHKETETIVQLARECERLLAGYQSGVKDSLSDVHITRVVTEMDEALRRLTGGAAKTVKRDRFWA